MEETLEQATTSKLPSKEDFKLAAGWRERAEIVALLHKSRVFNPAGRPKSEGKDTRWGIRDTCLYFGISYYQGYEYLKLAETIGKPEFDGKTREEILAVIKKNKPVSEDKNKIIKKAAEEALALLRGPIDPKRVKLAQATLENALNGKKVNG